MYAMKYKSIKVLIREMYDFHCIPKDLSQPDSSKLKPKMIYPHMIAQTMVKMKSSNNRYLSCLPKGSFLDGGLIEFMIMAPSIINKRLINVLVIPKKNPSL